jgi:ribosome-binding protein aMBF1 (putative translation factor)
MNALTEQVIYQNGQPAFVVIPYEAYMTKYNKEAGNYIPQTVVDLMFENDYSLIKSWRVLKGLSQSQLAEKAQMKQSAIARLEADKHTPTKATLEKLAFALGVHVEQLSLDEI